MLAGSGQQLLESLDWTIVEVTLGPDSQRLVHGPCELKCCERTPEDKTYVIYLACGRVHWEGLRCGTMGSWDSGQRSRMTYEESNGKAYIVGQWEAGTQVYRLRKEARSGTTQGVQWEGLRCGTTGSWDSVYRSGMDSVVRGHWTSYLQMVWGTQKCMSCMCIVLSQYSVLNSVKEWPKSWSPTD